VPDGKFIGNDVVGIGIGMLIGAAAAAAFGRGIGMGAGAGVCPVASQEPSNNVVIMCHPDSEEFNGATIPDRNFHLSG
jgi:hypothetical protein